MRFKIFSLAILILAICCVSNSYAQNNDVKQNNNGWRKLFNGKDLTGWSHVGDGKFVLENSLLRTDGGMGILWYTPQKFGNCVIKVVYKTTYPTSNSGVFVRIADKPTDAWYAAHHGYEIQILDSPEADVYHHTGAVYSLAKISTKAEKPAGEWNTMEITLKGMLIQVKLNGILVNNFDSTSTNLPPRQQDTEPERGLRPEYGYIGLQNEDHIDNKKDSHVYFKEVSVKPLTTH